MPVKAKMSWEGSPNYRWIKMKNGSRHRVTCEQLGLPEQLWTKEDSIQLSNEWWDKQNTAPETPFSDLANKILPDADETHWKAKFAEMLGYDFQTQTFAKPINSEKDIIKSLGLESNPEFAREAVIPFFEERTQTVPKFKGRDLAQCIQDFLTLKRNKANEGTLKRLESDLAKLNDMKHNGRQIFRANQDPKTIDEDAITGFSLWLASQSYSNNHKCTIQASFRQFIEWLWRQRIIQELPRNLKSRESSTPRETKQVKKYDTAIVRQFLLNLKERFKLYALLALNCSMYPVDMATLTHDMIDWHKGTLTRKRVKTKKKETTPTVTYKLWDETKALLKKHRSKHAQFVLTNARNKPMEQRGYRNGKAFVANNISKQWGDAKPKLTIPLTDFRKIGASLVRSHPTLSHLTTYYLANTPSGITEKHYAHESDEQFFILLAWMEQKVFNPD